MIIVLIVILFVVLVVMQVKTYTRLSEPIDNVAERLSFLIKLCEGLDFTAKALRSAASTFDKEAFLAKLVSESWEFAEQSWIVLNRAAGKKPLDTQREQTALDYARLRAAVLGHPLDDKTAEYVRCALRVECLRRREARAT